MNIAIFASAFHPSLGGVEELVRQLAHAYTRRGLKPIILTNRWPRDLPSHEMFEGLPLYRLALRSPGGTRRDNLVYALTRPFVEAQMRAILRRHDVSLLHVQCVSAAARFALQAQRQLRLPLVVTLQGELTMDASRLFERSPSARQLMHDALREAHAITACSGQTLAEAEAFFGQPFGDRGSVIYNGIRLAEFENVAPHREKRPYIFAIGRHVKQKGFDVLLHAFAAASQNGTDHDLVLAGDGKERSNLEKLAAELNLGERVRFVGRLEHEEAVRYFAGCSFFVLPSRHEPMGIVNLEAMAAGKAVVASKVGGVPELVIEGETGLLVPGGDSAFLSLALAKLMTDDDLRARLGAAGALRAQKFDWDALAAQYLAVYQSVAVQSPVAARP